ncbi:MAG: hypothetical protein SGJ20_06155, partial [Planctomycetota bacterium]|nr:hypothetical protein [Planctomycetota bacterium]
VAATISFVSCTTSAANLTTYTFTAHATGTAGTRKTIVGVTGEDGTSDFSVDSMTVGGVSAAEVVDSANASSAIQSALYIIDNPSGTTADIVVTFSEAVTSSAVCVFAAYDISSETAVATASQYQATSANIVLSLDVSADGVAVGQSAFEGSSQTTTWAGLVENAPESCSAEACASSAHYTEDATASSPLTAGSDWTGSGESIGVSASFR